MRKERKAALNVLAKAADVHNCWACLDEAVTCGEDDGFTREYVEGEREMLADAILDEMRSLRKLGKRYGIKVEVSCIDIRHWEVGE